MQSEVEEPQLLCAISASGGQRVRGSTAHDLGRERLPSSHPSFRRAATSQFTPPAPRLAGLAARPPRSLRPPRPAPSRSHRLTARPPPLHK